MTLDAIMALVKLLAPIAETLAPKILSAIQDEITAHQGLTVQQRTDLLSQLETKLDAGKAIVDALTATAKPD